MRDVPSGARLLSYMYLLLKELEDKFLKGVSLLGTSPYTHTDTLTL
jgi:hypothetical protein